MILCATAIAACISSAAFADADAKGYVVTQNPPPAKYSATLGRAAHLIDIVVNNYASEEVYLTVPGTIHKAIYPGISMHIINDYQQRPYTAVYLFDAHDNNFFSGQMCPYSIIDVYGTPPKSGGVFAASGPSTGKPYES